MFQSWPPFGRSRRDPKHVAPAPSLEPLSDILMRFESLGIGCDFGLVQRICGAEPLGLFRFAGSRVENLTRVLETGLDGFLIPDDLELEVRGTEYMTFSKVYADFYTHTQAHTDRHDRASIVSRELRKADYLKQRFLSDWAAGDRIYVHCGCEDEAAILALRDALNARTPCVLLWVAVDADPARRGRVEALAPTLLKGYVAHGGSYEWEPRLDLPGWAAVCRSADAIIRRLPMPTRTSLPPMAAAFRWERDESGEIAVTPAMVRCRVLAAPAFSAPIARLAVTASFGQDHLVVVSMWVSLSKTFKGRTMVLTSQDAFAINAKRADLSIREAWQQIWLVMRVPGPTDGIGIVLRVDAEWGAQFDLAGWQIEAGAIPGEDARPGAPAPELSYGPAPAVPISRARGARFRERVSHALRRASNAIAPKTDNGAASALADERTATTLLTKADLLIHARRFDEAEAVLSAATVLFPWRPELFTHRALCAGARGDAAEALKRWDEVVRLFPEFALGHYRLAAALRATGDLARSQRIVEAALPRFSDDPAMVSEAARVFAAARRWPEAVAQWDAAIALGGEHPDWIAERDIARERCAAL